MVGHENFMVMPKLNDVPKTERLAPGSERWPVRFLKRHSRKLGQKAKLHVGRGSFKSGTFKKLTGNSQGGGLIVVGPFDKDADCVTEIRDEAFRKFQSLHREFRKQYHTAHDMTLVYPDGSKVCGLPDGSADFSIKGYRDYLDPHKKYDRLRFFLVPTVEIGEEVDLVSADDSSSSLPDLSDIIESQTLSNVLRDIRGTAHEAKDQEEECESSCSPPLGTSSQIDLTYDDTLPLVVKVRFTSNGHAILTGRFEISDKVEELVRYVQSSGTLQGSNFQLLKNGEILETRNELHSYIGNPNEVVEIEVKQVVERSERVFAGLGRRCLSLRRPRIETETSATR
ncbi:uncharacterized protein LOC117343326 [Pecten maximus]|uniref:uncharacterized protein LOC117343326 n=1 Tax=Pecten maximus TaxID=6579 RepID=UPI001458322E|nr:uncharacterized protein LOC117343326 [Pecten maximus]